MHPEPLVYSRLEAAEACRVGLDAIDKAIHSGRLKAKKIGRRYVIRRQDLQAWIDSQPDA